MAPIIVYLGLDLLLLVADIRQAQKQYDEILFGINQQFKITEEFPIDPTICQPETEGNEKEMDGRIWTCQNGFWTFINKVFDNDPKTQQCKWLFEQEGYPENLPAQWDWTWLNTSKHIIRSECAKWFDGWREYKN